MSLTRAPAFVDPEENVRTRNCRQPRKQPELSEMFLNRKWLRCARVQQSKFIQTLGTQDGWHSVLVRPAENIKIARNGLLRTVVNIRTPRSERTSPVNAVCERNDSRLFVPRNPGDRATQKIIIMCARNKRVMINSDGIIIIIIRIICVRRATYEVNAADVDDNKDYSSRCYYY